MNELISKRWSPRAFSADAVVSDDELRTVLEAARWAPSHGNSQPARFVLGHRGSPTFDAIFETLRPGNKTWAVRASVLLIGCVITPTHAATCRTSSSASGSRWRTSPCRPSTSA